MTGPLIDSNHIRMHVSMLAELIGERNTAHPRALHLAADYIIDQWQEMGYEVRTQTFRARGVECSNLEVSHVGTTDPDTITLLGAHYDSGKGSPGANDNASGIAVLLEVSRAIREMETRHTIRFVAFANQEAPYFGTDEMGSWIYSHRARERGDNIRAAVILETLGYYSDAPSSQLAPLPLSLLCPSRGNFVAMVSNLNSMGLSRRFTRAFRRHSSFPCHQISAPQILPSIASSDQNPFWLNGYKAFVVTDTARYRYPFYHSAKDTPDKINCDHIGQISDGLLKALMELEQ